MQKTIPFVVAIKNLQSDEADMSRLVRVVINLKDAVLDPQGDAILNALKALGFDNVDNVRVGKVISLTFKNEKNAVQLTQEASLMAQKLLCNGVMENFQIQVETDRSAS